VDAASGGARLLCHEAFGSKVAAAKATTVADVRKAGVGLVGEVFRTAFLPSPNKTFAAWCIVTTAYHCYDEWAVAANGARRHIATAGCGWPHGTPFAGPPYWTF
jgi:hypothetical protein